MLMMMMRKEKEKEDMPREKSNNPNLKGGEQNPAQLFLVVHLEKGLCTLLPIVVQCGAHNSLYLRTAASAKIVVHTRLAHKACAQPVNARAQLRKP